MTRSPLDFTDLSQRIFDSEIREPRSKAYEMGLRQGVALRLTGACITNRFVPSSAERDAFDAGAQRGLDCTAAYMHQYAHENKAWPQLYSDPGRLAARLSRGRALADRIIKDMQRRGMREACLIGSMASGSIHEHSDIDILVIDCGTLDPVYVIGEVIETYCREPGEEGIKIDCVVLALMPEKDRQKWLEMRTCSAIKPENAMDHSGQNSNRSPQAIAGKPGIEDYRIAVAQTILERFSLQEVRQKSLENLSRWKAQGTWSSYYDEWMRLMLNGSDTEVITAMTSSDDMASRLRGASPYPGLLDEETVRALRLKHRGK